MLGSGKTGAVRAFVTGQLGRAARTPTFTAVTLLGCAGGRC